jgi:putative component of toxin-antitoxin plasmid stabilization module
MILLLAGGDKSSQKKDIARAIEYLQDNQRRTGDDR